MAQHFDENESIAIAMDIFGPLPMTNKCLKYVLSIQDILTKYPVLIPLKNTSSEKLKLVWSLYIYSDHLSLSSQARHGTSYQNQSKSLKTYLELDV